MTEDRDRRLELFFSLSLEGFFFMMLDAPVRWDDSVDKEAVLDYVFAHQRITDLNEAMLQQYAATSEQLLGLTPADVFRHDPAYGRQLWREFFDRGHLHVETQERKLDGTPIWIEGDYICLYDPEGRITGHFGIQRDITARRLMSDQIARHAAELEERVAERTEELRRSETRMRAIVSALPDVLMVVDEEGRYVEILTSDTDLHFRSASDLKGKTFHEVLPPALAGEFLAVTQETLRTGQSRVIEYPLAVPAGERWFEGRTGYMAAGLDGRRCVVFVARDITDRKRAAALEDQNRLLLEELKTSYGHIVGGSPAMLEVFRNMEMVAATDATVLLHGETGTGKELIARAVHDRSRRAGGVMVRVNCGVLPAGLAESELFGHEKGAFTGATQQKKGRFELADGGTIFLDEIGELGLDVQVKLLRVLQEQEFERLGGNKTFRVDVRVIAATNRDLLEEVRRGAFRADLYYRLSVFPIAVPPLRDREEDIPALASHFVRRFSQRLGKRVDGISAPAMACLAAYDWPGNVRELSNILERAVILCQGTRIQEEQIALSPRTAAAAPKAEASAAGADSLATLTLEEMERQHIIRALERTGGILAGPRGAASLLGVNRSTLWSRMRKLGIATGRSAAEDAREETPDSA